MSNTKLYIPSRLKVGYNNRQDTYTKKLAYVIYYDEKNKLRKEASWSGWIDKKMGSDEFDNVPTEGFVLNKGVGGTRESWGWNARNEYIRVYDPRGFEFEISVANLLYILQECTSTKGKGLEGQFVYSWDGADLVLLPVGTYEYEQSSNFTENRGLKFTKKELKAGNSYLFKNMEEYLYLGEQTIPVKKMIANSNYGKELPNQTGYYKQYDRSKKIGHMVDDKRYVFYNLKSKDLYFLGSYANISKLQLENHPSYEDASIALMNKNSKIVSFTPTKIDTLEAKTNSWNNVIVKQDDKYYSVSYVVDDQGRYRINSSYHNYYYLSDGQMKSGWLQSDRSESKFVKAFCYRDGYYDYIDPAKIMDVAYADKVEIFFDTDTSIKNMSFNSACHLATKTLSL